MTPGTGRRIVVSRHTDSGFGDHLSCLFGAWRYAKRTDRELVIDWRGSRFSSQAGKNFFDEVFQPVSVLAGVRVTSGDDIDYRDSGPFYWPKWSADALASVAHVPHTSEEIGAMNALAAQGADRGEPVVVFNQHLAPDPPQEDLRDILASLTFAQSITDRVDAFLAEMGVEGPLIGVHIRHGNGENIGGRAAYWLDPWDLTRQLRRNRGISIHHRGAGDGPAGAYRDNTAPSLTARPSSSFVERRLYRQVAALVGDYRRRAGLAGAHVALCTDAPRVETGLGAHLDKIVRYPKTFHAAGGGPLHQTVAAGRDGGLAHDIVTDMLVETELLRRASALICIPSQFTVITRAELAATDITNLKPPLVNRVVSKLFA